MPLDRRDPANLWEIYSRSQAPAWERLGVSALLRLLVADRAMDIGASAAKQSLAGKWVPKRELGNQVIMRSVWATFERRTKQST